MIAAKSNKKLAKRRVFQLFSMFYLLEIIGNDLTGILFPAVCRQFVNKVFMAIFAIEKIEAYGNERRIFG